MTNLYALCKVNFDSNDVTLVDGFLLLALCVLDRLLAKIGESTKVFVTPPQIFVWVQLSPATTKKIPKNSSNRFQIGF